MPRRVPKPVCFEVRATLPQSPHQIAGAILDLDQWPSFKGWGPLPGIRSAVFERRTQDIVGTRINVTNTDGSTHTEEVTAWDPPRTLALRLEGFSRPLSALATHFDETWRFDPPEDLAPTHATRTFELWPRSPLTRPTVLLIAAMLKRAIRSQLRQLAAGARSPSRRHPGPPSSTIPRMSEFAKTLWGLHRAMLLVCGGLIAVCASHQPGEPYRLAIAEVDELSKLDVADYLRQREDAVEDLWDDSGIDLLSYYGQGETSWSKVLASRLWYWFNNGIPAELYELTPTPGLDDGKLRADQPLAILRTTLEGLEIQGGAGVVLDQRRLDDLIAGYMRDNGNLTPGSIKYARWELPGDSRRSLRVGDEIEVILFTYLENDKMTLGFSESLACPGRVVPLPAEKLSAWVDKQPLVTPVYARERGVTRWLPELQKHWANVGGMTLQEAREYLVSMEEGVPLEVDVLGVKLNGPAVLLGALAALIGILLAMSSVLKNMAGSVPRPDADDPRAPWIGFMGGREAHLIRWVSVFVLTLASVVYMHVEFPRLIARLWFAPSLLGVGCIVLAGVVCVRATAVAARLGGAGAPASGGASVPASPPPASGDAPGAIGTGGGAATAGEPDPPVP
ncbi:MAG: SRPBCC family protein [Phycisphaerales bacterium]